MRDDSTEDLVRRASRIAMTAYIRSCKTQGVDPATVDEILPAFKPLLKAGIEETLQAYRDLDNGTPNVREGLDYLGKAILIGVGTDLFTTLHTEATA